MHARDQARHRLFLPSLVSSTESGGSGQAAHAAAFSVNDMRALVELADFQPIKSEVRLLFPVRMFGLGRLIDRFVAPWLAIRNLCLRYYTVRRSLRCHDDAIGSATVVILRATNGETSSRPCAASRASLTTSRSFLSRATPR